MTANKTKPEQREISNKRKIIILAASVVALAALVFLLYWFFLSPQMACSTMRVEKSIQPIQEQMREFDDYAAIVSNTGREQLAFPTSELQRIRRETEDIEVQDCLVTLKTASLEYMNQVISTALAFMRSENQEQVSGRLQLSRQLRAVYESERDRLLGVE